MAEHIARLVVLFVILAGAAWVIGVLLGKLIFWWFRRR